MLERLVGVVYGCFSGSRALISLSIMSIGIFVSLIVNLALLPLRIFIWVLRLSFGIF